VRIIDATQTDDRKSIQLASHRATGSQQTRRLVALVFDDGWQNQLDVAVPILRQYNIKATFSVITRSVGVGKSGSLWEYMGWDELHSLANDGMDIASHTRTQRGLGTMSREEDWSRRILRSP